MKKSCLMVLVLLSIAVGCARNSRVHLLPEGEFMEVIKDGKEAAVQKLVQVDF